MIILKNVTKKFNGKAIIDNVNLEIPKGEKLAVMGPSGCGKSTTLRLIMGLQRVTSGNVVIDGEDITFMKSKYLNRIRDKFGMVFQSSALFDSMNVRDNVGFKFIYSKNYTERQIDRIVEEKLEMVGLKGIENQMPSDLSGGMRKRVALARAIAADPEIILYDEPTTGLDPITCTVIEKLINKLNRELSITSVIVTHQISTIFNTADRIIMMNNGKFTPAGTPQEAKRTENPVIHNFLNGIVKEERI